MDFVVVERSLAACAVVTLVLVALHYGGRLALRSSVSAGRRGSLLAIVETAFLPGAASLHVIRVCERYYVVGRSGAHIEALAEIPAEAVALQQNRGTKPVGPQFVALRDAFERLRRPSR
ncbi:MAG: flagellar biosynthetic protein FliO [Candidatus Eremiobacteraeota bacterium]|nr:flagellar biosynthetic protein FliO [Candidatus Eremiobacteraeota bacterium]